MKSLFIPSCVFYEVLYAFCSRGTLSPPSISLEEVLEAYYSCRKNKRHTANAARFEVDCEANLFKLWNEINNGEYRPGKSLAFIVEKSVKREIFAADFRDRIVHHLIISKDTPGPPMFPHNPNTCSPCSKDPGGTIASKALLDAAVLSPLHGTMKTSNDNGYFEAQ